MKRVLFVDDEARILDGLRRMLRPMRNEWQMEFAPGGEAALQMRGGPSSTLSCRICACRESTAPHSSKLFAKLIRK